MILEFFSLVYLAVWAIPLLMAVLTLLGKPFIVGLPYLRLKSAITGPHTLMFLFFYYFFFLDGWAWLITRLLINYRDYVHVYRADKSSANTQTYANLLPRGAGRGRYLCPEKEVDLVPRNKIRKFCFFFTLRCSKTWMFLKAWIWLWCRLSVTMVKKCLIHLQEFAWNSINPLNPKIKI